VKQQSYFSPIAEEIPMTNKLLVAALGLALAFTLGCEEKTADKAAAAADQAKADYTEKANAYAKAQYEKAKAEQAQAEAEAKAAVEKQAEADRVALEFSKAEKEAKKAVSCKGNEKVKLLAGITDEKGKPESKFEYDERNRIVKIYQYSEGKLYSIETIAYSGDDLVTVEKISSNERNVSKYVIKGNTMTLNDNPFTINKDGSIARENLTGSRTYTYEDGHEAESNFIPYTYQNGNLTKEGPDNSDNSIFSYDDKKSPFSNTNTPKWLIQQLLRGDFASKNNVLSISTEVCLDVCPPTEYQYEYDSDGFPTKQTWKSCQVEDCYTGIKRYTYCGGSDGK